MIKRVAILANGGDVSGFNAVIRAIIKTAENNNIECLGFIDGYRGLLQNNFVQLATDARGNAKDYPNAVVIVSHDRMFLDQIVNKVYEIEYATMTEYVGNYTRFEEQKRANYEKQLKDYEYQQAEIKRLKAIADRFR